MSTLNMASPKSQWAGVFKFPEQLLLDCSLYAAAGKSLEFPFVEVHTPCLTPTKKKKRGGSESDEDSSETSSEAAANDDGIQAADADPLRTSKTVEQEICSKCEQPILSSDKGRAVDSDLGLLLLTEKDIASVTFERDKEVEAILCDDPDNLIDLIGRSTRYIIIPKPAFVDVYDQLYFNLSVGRRCALIPQLTISSKSGPSAAVIRTLCYPASIFGVERKILILEMINDPDALNDPATLRGYHEVTFNDRERTLVLAQRFTTVMSAQGALVSLTSDRLAHPRIAALKNLIEKLKRRSKRQKAEAKA